MQLLIELSNNQSFYPNAMILTVLAVVGIVGFIAAVTVGSIALYNSKRPLDGQNEKPSDFIPKIDK